MSLPLCFFHIFKFSTPHHSYAHLPVLNLRFSSFVHFCTNFSISLFICHLTLAICVSLYLYPSTCVSPALLFSFYLYVSLCSCLCFPKAYCPYSQSFVLNLDVFCSCLTPKTSLYRYLLSCALFHRAFYVFYFRTTASFRICISANVCLAYFHPGKSKFNTQIEFLKFCFLWAKLGMKFFCSWSAEMNGLRRPPANQWRI